MGELQYLDGPAFGHADIQQCWHLLQYQYQRERRPGSSLASRVFDHSRAECTGQPFADDFGCTGDVGDGWPGVQLPADCE